MSLEQAERISKLNVQLDARESDLRKSANRLEEMEGRHEELKGMFHKRGEVIEQNNKDLNALRHENYRLKVRLDALLWALVCVQLKTRHEVRQDSASTPDEVFLAAGVDLPAKE